MPLTLWTEHGTGYRSVAFFARIAESLGRHSHSCYYVVPDATQKRIAEDLCLPSGSGLFFGNAILSLSEWLGRLVPTDRPMITAATRERLVAQILPKLPLSYFRLQGHHGRQLLTQGIVATLMGGLSAAELSQLAHDYGQEREQDLALLYSAYLAELDRRAWWDPAQLPLLARTMAQTETPLATSRAIVEVGVAPPPVLWSLLRTLAHQAPDMDLHVITPEMHRHTAETLLGEAAREIRPEEWVATEPATCQLYRAPNAGAEYHWMDTAISKALSTPHREAVALLAASPDPTPWLAHCAEIGLTTDTAPFSLAAAPVSAPWSDPQIWRDAPPSATMEEWASMWQAQMAKPERLREWIHRLPQDATASRALRDLARWEEVWRQLSASVNASSRISAEELCEMVHPIIHARPAAAPESLPYTALTLETVLGHRIDTLFVLDATQDLFPAVTPSPFFQRAALLPQDPNTTRLRGAFPGSDDRLALAIAAWQRLCGTANHITAIFSATHDRLGEQFPSLLLDGDPQDIPVREYGVAPSPATPLPETFLVAADTMADVRRRMQDHIFSVSELEDFAACPFRHFARYILGIDVPEEDRPELPAHSEGDILHRLLEQYYKQERKPQSEEAIHHILAESLSRDILTDRPLRQIQCERLLRTATSAIVWEQTERERLGDRALTPMATEWKFGYGEVPALTVREGPHTIQLRGKIDRIDGDAAHHRILLMDYKYKQSLVGPVLGEIRNGQHLQIPIYILAAEAVFPGSQVLGGLLFDLKALTRHYGIARKTEAEFLGIRSTLKSLVKDETWEELLGTAVHHAITYAQTIRTGSHPRLPHDCHQCHWSGLLPWEGL